MLSTATVMTTCGSLVYTDELWYGMKRGSFPHYRPFVQSNYQSGPCITNVIATFCNNFSQWGRSFLWKLRCHWLKFLRRVAKTLVIQGPSGLAAHRASNTCLGWFIFYNGYAMRKVSVNLCDNNYLSNQNASVVYSVTRVLCNALV